MGRDDQIRQGAVTGGPDTPVRSERSARPTEPATWVRYQVLAAGCLLALLTYIQRLGFSSALPNIKQSLGLNDEHSGYLTAAFLIAYGGFQVIGGLLGDRLGA